MKVFEEYSENMRELEITLRSFLLRELHEGVIMTKEEFILENTLSKAEFEIKRLQSAKGNSLLISEFIPEILSLVKKFGESGQSGGSAPYTTSAIVNTIKKLLMHEPLGGIENTDDEWEDVTKINGGEPMFHNKRLSSVFKSSKESQPYYLDAIVFRNPETGCTFTSGSVDLPENANDGKGGKIGSSHYIKSFPFEPKTFTIDVDETEYRKNKDGSLTPEKGGGWWESIVKDPSQLEEVWKYYDRK